MTILERASKTSNFEEWICSINQTCAPYHGKPLGSEFSGAVYQHISGSLDISLVDACQVEVTRGVDDISRNYGGCYHAAFQLSGECYVEQNDNRSRLNPGDIVLLDSSIPSTIVVNENSRQLTVALPRTEIERAFGNGTFLCGEAILASSALAPIAFVLVKDATQRFALSEEESDAIIKSIVQLLRPAYSSKLSEQDNYTAIFNKAIRLIDQNLMREDLTPEYLAQKIGVSLRSLYRIFSSKNLVIAQYIKNRRLDFCADALRNARGTLKLSVLAYSWGFSDPSHFSNAFKSRFGISPGEYRKNFNTMPAV